MIAYRYNFVLSFFFPYALGLLLTFAHAAHIYFPSIPEDLYAFPKFRVSFLNGFPLLNDTAQGWLAEGIPGGEDEFLGRVSHRNDQPSKLRKEISEHGNEPLTTALQDSVAAASPPLGLHLMKMGTKASYLCLIPQPPPSTAFSSAEEYTPAHPRRAGNSYSLCLKGVCIIHWVGSRTPIAMENTSSSLERRLMPTLIPQGAENQKKTLSTQPRNIRASIARGGCRANKLELARGAGQRYLVQRWESGTVCDKTGVPRKAEVQFHCSMTTTDKIFLIKEASTCSYVVVIHTPRLCGEPGFKSERDTQEESVMRCREIMSEGDYARHLLLSPPQATIPNPTDAFPPLESDMSESTPKPSPYSEDAHPLNFPSVRGPSAAPPSPPPPPPAAVQKDATTGTAGDGDGSNAQSKEDASAKSSKLRQGSSEALKQALRALLRGATQGDGAEPGGENEHQQQQPINGREEVFMIDGQDGEKIHVIIGDLHDEDDVEQQLSSLMENARQEAGRSKLDALRKKLMEVSNNKDPGLAAPALKKEDVEDASKNEASDSQENVQEDDGLPATHDEL
ncbi:uncharacterized protein EI90DRAFT_3015120 [Cantharellus anzutake]|uniref:uncharacterized protein n=1 Tax=Cantharellus anzutake TaxID=1750568 RepID=UPI00190902DE|nr:uncharacterized protein EI90DRAFT_3015120 [Cantharellus anzutake]KAF8334059.1 hypothetical protein EI90DRAFT_3015120 [Cantharellus anzutake]